MYNTIIEALKDFKLNLAQRLSRSILYDNASNMSGSILVCRPKELEENDKAIYILCTAHSLNLSEVSAAESCVNAVSFFGFVEKLYHIDGIF